MNTDAELFLWVRNSKKLAAKFINNQRVTLLVGDLRNPIPFKYELSTITRLIHTATAWGDPERANQVNVVAVKALLRLLDPTIIEQIIYFSTASILNKSLQPIPEALLYGTEYIQTKAKCLHQLEEHPLSHKIIAVFPTLVFGGRLNERSQFPTSYLTAGLAEASKWLWLARWFSADSRFHFIHAADIAFICGHLATIPHISSHRDGKKGVRKIVMGQAPISINQAIDELRKWLGLSKTPQLPLWAWLIEVLIKILPIKLSSWDRFSIKQRHFLHDPITAPEHFGAQSFARTLNDVLADSGLPRAKDCTKGAKVIKEVV